MTTLPTKGDDSMFKNLTERDLVWAWRIMVLICAIFTACSASYVASSVMMAQYRIWHIGGQPTSARPGMIPSPSVVYLRALSHPR